MKKTAFAIMMLFPLISTIKMLTSGNTTGHNIEN